MLRLLTNRLLRYGNIALQRCCKKSSYITILENRKRPKIPAKVLKAGDVNHVKPRLTSDVFRLRHHAKRILANNILNRATSSYSAQVKHRATREVLYGYSRPSFALVGVTVGSGATLLTKEDELEAFCLEIREAALYLQDILSENNGIHEATNEINLDDLEIGKPIAKGCSAVVYAASFKDKNFNHHSQIDSMGFGLGDYLRKCFKIGNIRSSMAEIMAIVRSYNRFLHAFGKAKSEIPKNTISVEEKQISSNLRKYSESDMTKVSTAPMYKYPLALKMVFNYDIQSNAYSILNAMRRELIPVPRYAKSDTVLQWEKSLQEDGLELPPHPNIVFMLGAFCAQIPDLNGGRSLYPMALPPRLNPDGLGRNMSLFLLMKRYNCSLREYLDANNVDGKTRLLLFAELLEAVAHLSRHGIAHRDLKSDNILIESCGSESAPVLVISDFGCCLADSYHGLRLPYTSQYIEKGGNASLMAPEIANKAPGPFSILDYSKSDLWACGAISYEIFDQQNPFYASANLTDEFVLRNTNYKETDLPEINTNCPPLIKNLITNILNPNPHKRMRPDVAANVMQLYLWAPSAWLKPNGMPSDSEILQWLLTLTTKVMCEGKFGSYLDNVKSRISTELLLISSFLARARLRSIKSAFNWIQSVV